MTHLVVSALAVLWAWEYLLTLSPLVLPAWMQPALVAGCALGVGHVPDRFVTAAACAGLVALLHRFVAPATARHTVVRRRSGGLPPL